MNRAAIRTNINTALSEDGVYRTSTFINDVINEGNALVSAFSLCDERSANVDVNGSRNFNPVPLSGDAYCFAPLFVANSNTGYRLSPCKVEEFELYNAQWEGRVGSDGGSMYYTYINPFHGAYATLVCCPIQNIGKTQLKVVGAYVFPEFSGDTTVPRMDEEFQDLLVLYGVFYGLLSEPGMGKRAAEVLTQFVSRLNEFTASIRSRFPSGRDFESVPVEFTYENITDQDRKVESKGEGR